MRDRLLDEYLWVGKDLSRNSPERLRRSALLELADGLVSAAPSADSGSADGGPWVLAVAATLIRVGALMAVFSDRMLPEVVQTFWAALQRSEFITDAAIEAGHIG